jgi:hypothetical protein
VFVDEDGDLSFRNKRRRKRWRDGEESSKSGSLVSERLLLVETGIETEGGIETTGHVLVRPPHPIVPRRVRGQDHEPGNLVAVSPQKAVHFLIRYDQRAETAQEDHIPGTSGLILELM